METTFTKILRRLHQKGILPGAVRAVYRMCADRKALDMSTELAWKKVHAIAPRPEGSSYWEMPDGAESVYDVSVIIPFYKTEQYAVQCIESVLSQETNFKMEVILVDDGSPDRCGEILDSYADRENVVVIHQKNQGVSMARNTGIVASRGDYVIFLDSDDYMAPGTIHKLMTAARQHDADMAEGGHETVTTAGQVLQRCCKTPGVYTHGANMFGYPWGKVMRKTLFRNICFPVGYWYEDCIIANLIFPTAQTTVTIPDIVCYYRQNPEGLTAATGGNPKSIHTLYVTADVLHTARKLELECSDVQRRLLIMELSLWLLRRVSWMKEEEIQALFIAACDIAERFQLLPIGSNGDYFYDEIVEALRHRQYSRWKWASLLI